MNVSLNIYFIEVLNFDIKYEYPNKAIEQKQMYSMFWLEFLVLRLLHDQGHALKANNRPIIVS